MGMKNYTVAVSTKKTKQSEKIPGSLQVQNNNGGFSWSVDDWTRLRRFLIIGSEGGSFYQKERKLTIENAEALLRCLAADGARVVAEIVEVSKGGLAHKNDPAIFALAMASAKGDERTRALAFQAVPQVCRIGTHLFQFAEARQAFGGWGRGMRNAISKWYLSRKIENLAVQLAKYQSRNGWSHRDLLRLSHVKAPDERTSKLLGWSAGKVQPHETEALIAAMQTAMHPDTSAATVVSLIADHRLTREMIRTDLLSKPEVQWALIQEQGLTALIRNLGNYSKSGLLKPMSEAEKFVVARLSNKEDLHDSRIHPFAVLLAARTYASGKGARSAGEWTICPNVVDALDAAFYSAFQNVEPTKKRHLLGIDISSSMTSSWGGTLMSAAEAAAAMAMVTFRSEEDSYAHGFSETFRDLGITRKMTLPQVLAKTTNQNFGGTDCAVPMQWALKNKVAVDQFIVYTDNETWAGDQHPSQALNEYRQKMGIPARLAVVAFTAGWFSIADPNDAGMMDFAGMDASLPLLLRAFALGEV